MSIKVLPMLSMRPKSGDRFSKSEKRDKNREKRSLKKSEVVEGEKNRTLPDS